MGAKCKQIMKIFGYCKATVVCLRLRWNIEKEVIIIYHSVCINNFEALTGDVHTCANIRNFSCEAGMKCKF